MHNRVRRAIANLFMAIAFLGISYASYTLLPWRAHLSALDVMTGLVVLLVAEFATLQSRSGYFRFRLAAQLPLLLQFGVFPVVIGQGIVLVLEQLRESMMTRTLALHAPRILSAVLVPALSGVVFEAIVSTGSSIFTRTGAMVGAAVAFWVLSAIFHLLPGRRSLIHPWAPIRGWLAVLLILDATMAFGAIVQQSFGHQGAQLAVTLELVALMGSVALYTDASIRKFQLVNLTNLVSDLASDMDWGRLANHIFEGIRRMVVVDVAVLWFVREDGRLYPYRVYTYDAQNSASSGSSVSSASATSEVKRLEQALSDDQGDGVQFGMGLVGFAASTRDVIAVHSTKQPLLFHWDGMRKLSPSALASPILISREVVAVLSVYHTSAQSAYSSREQALFRIFSKQLGSIFAMMWRYEQTKMEAKIDELTGLYNYRHFDEALHQCVADSDALHQPLTLLLMDLDHFKQINDRYGHLAGNQVLVALAHTLKEMVRADDIVARYGGEEFTILLPGLASREGQAIAERIRQKVENMTFEIDSGLDDFTRPEPAHRVANKVTHRESGATQLHKVKITLSIGVATYPDSADSPLTLIRHADRAMYVGSKQSGRNKVSTYSQG